MCSLFLRKSTVSQLKITFSQAKCLVTSSFQSQTVGKGKETTAPKYQEEKTNSNKPKEESAHSYILKKRKKHLETPKDTDVKSKVNLAKGEKHDSQGFRNMTDQVTNLDKFTHDEVLEKLKKRVVYDHNDIVALNKPYGLPCHEGGGKTHHLLTNFLRELGECIDPSNPNRELFTVHRLDKETTGILVLARTQQMADKLRLLFSERKMTKVYWTITIKVPRDREGVIDIPMAEGKVGNKFRMILKPDLTNQYKYMIPRNYSDVTQAVSYYKVIRELGSAAIVEVRPATGVKHQIRAHLGLGLSCPILGDHKYSEPEPKQIVPQKLPEDMLKRLGVRQSKARTIPFHLHAKALLIPDVLEGRDLVLSSPLPKFFIRNLTLLRLNGEEAITPNINFKND